jgi:hypothetical protein
MQYDYIENSIGGPARLTGSAFGYGRTNLGSGFSFGTEWSLTISDNSFARVDWLYGSASNAANARIVLINNTVTLNGGVNNGGTAAAYPVSFQNGGPTPSTYISPFAIGNQVLVFNGGNGSVNNADISLTPDLTNTRLTCNGDLRGTLASKAGDPIVGDIAAGTWALYKNTSSGDVKLWANDGGVLKSVTLT